MSTDLNNSDDTINPGSAAHYMSGQIAMVTWYINNGLDNGFSPIWSQEII